jgi:16S rRNA processing protein RimM
MVEVDPDRRILLGEIGPAHGIRGEVVVRSYADAPEDIAAYGPLSDEAGRRTFDLKVVRVTDKGVIVRIAGIGDRTAAEGLRGTKLFVNRDRLPAAGDGAYYHADLIGLAAVDLDGREIGRIVGVQNFGAGDLIEIALTSSRTTELIPFNDDFVPNVDLERGRVTVVRPPDDGEPPQNRDPAG